MANASPAKMNDTFLPLLDASSFAPCFLTSSTKLLMSFNESGRTTRNVSIGHRVVQSSDDTCFSLLLEHFTRLLLSASLHFL